VEKIVLQAAWHCDRNSNVINDPLGEPGCTPLYAGLPSAWGSMESDRMIFPFFKAEFLSWGL